MVNGRVTITSCTLLLVDGSPKCEVNKIFRFKAGGKSICCCFGPCWTGHVVEVACVAGHLERLERFDFVVEQVRKNKLKPGYFDQFCGGFGVQSK